LLLVSVTEPDRHIEAIGDVEDVVREQRPVVAFLLVDVAGAADVAHPVEPVDGGVNRRRCCPERSWARRKTASGSRAVEAGKRASGHKAASREPAIVVTKPKRIREGQMLVREIAADQPVELV